MLDFLQILQKITSIFGLKLPVFEKLNFASFQNGGFAQNGHQKIVF
jgi:hypothetical protein